MTHLVADLSHFQTGIDMAAVKAAGAEAVILKAVEGTRPDPSFTTLAAAARAQGLGVSAYAFLRPGDSAAQARALLAVTSGHTTPGARLWADDEAVEHGVAHGFTATLQQSAPVGIYTGSWWWGPHGDPTCQHCASLPLWLSGYPNAYKGVAGRPKAQDWPRAPRPWSTVDVWQFSDSYPIAGWPGGIDMSATDDLSVVLPGSTPAPPPEVFVALSDAEQQELLTDIRDARVAIGEMVQNSRDIRVAVGTIVNQQLPAVLQQNGKAAAVLSALTAPTVDPTALAAAVADALPAELAQQVVAALTARLAQ